MAVHGKINILILTEVLIVVQTSCVFCEKFNMTDLLREKFFGSRLEDMSPVIGDASYLPEDDYLDDSQETWINNLKQLRRYDRNLMPEYHSLCETVTRKVELEDSEYEYQPPHYHEIFCKGYPLNSDDPRIEISFNQKCAHPSFHCVQRSRTMFILRRRWEENCWEPFTKEVASGCDCMWPTSLLGSIAPHY
ncbi:uncharacterized protein [Prorops nasuta]|uniref:uncharacterized protein isoform X2 n=1 Tax=Prorops nasuta TaxID=863751 RepID=UPI0034CEB98D